MKQNTLLLLVIVLLCSGLISCQKEIVTDIPPDPAPGSVKLKTYIEDARNTPFSSIDTFDITYDVQDRIVSVVGRATGLRFLYAYQQASYITDIKVVDHLIIQDISFLNAAGWTDSTFQTNDEKDSSATRLIYNMSGQVVEERLYTYTTETGSIPDGNSYYEYDANGNVVKYTEKAATGQTIAVTSYTYNGNLNTVFLTPTSRPLPYKNLPVTKSIYYPGSGTESSTYEYTYDSNNNVTSEKETGSDGSFVIKKYIYN